MLKILPWSLPTINFQLRTPGDSSCVSSQLGIKPAILIQVIARQSAGKNRSQFSPVYGLRCRGNQRSGHRPAAEPEGLTDTLLSPLDRIVIRVKVYAVLAAHE